MTRRSDLFVASDEQSADGAGSLDEGSDFDFAMIVSSKLHRTNGRKRHFE